MVVVQGGVRKATRGREGGSYLLIRVVRLCMPWPVLASSEVMFRFGCHETGIRRQGVQ